MTKPFRFTSLLCCGALLAAAPAHAGWLDTLFGAGSQTAPATQTAQATAAGSAREGTGQRLWRIREFSSIERVPREAGAANAPGSPGTPPTPTPELLREQLAAVRFDTPGGPQPLFAADELAELAGPLARAIGLASPAEDLLLLSSSRRDAGVLFAPTAVTARLFVQGGNLQLIVHDARFDFYDTYRGTQRQPTFVFGSRTAAGTVSIRSPGASSVRSDWLSIPLRPMAALPSAVAPPGPATATNVAPAVVPAPAAAAPTARKPLDAATADDIERRLETLKRLREKNLLSEDEYQQKRQEILRLL